MDIRIQGESLDGAASLQTSRTQEMALTGQSERQRASKAGESGGDSVEISGLSARISEASQQLDLRASDRVAALAALYARGPYQVDTRNLSQALVSHALSGAVEGDGT